MRRTTQITALAVVLGAVLAAPASATFPGENGPILYRTLDPQTGVGRPLIRALPDGSGATVISRKPGLFSDWRADGRRIAFDLVQPNGNVQIATSNPAGGDLRVITHGRGIHELPSWSPSGRRIVFDHSPKAPDTPGFATRLWTMRADGSHARPLPMRRPGFDVEPKYSPDGSRIVFARLRLPTKKHGLLTAILIVPAKGGPVRRLTPWTEIPSRETPKDAYVEHPTWSPDSRWILFNVAPNGSIQAMRPDGSDRHTIRPATRSFGGHKPWFSPDGTRIVLMCENQGTRAKPPADAYEHICVMDADGSNLVHLTSTPGVFENWPSWGPAPTN
jgi:Tol biopolymer transport system component